MLAGKQAAREGFTSSQAAGDIDAGDLQRMKQLGTLLRAALFSYASSEAHVFFKLVSGSL